MIIVIFLLSAAIALYWYSQYTRDGADEPPALPGGWPVLGHVPILIVNDSCTMWKRINKMADEINKLGGVALARFGPRTIYFVCDPDDMLTIANSCLDKEGLHDILKPWMGNGLITSEASKWKRDRKIVHPAFSQAVLNSFMGVFNRQSRKLVTKMEVEAGEGLFDHFQYIKESILEITCLTALGVDFSDKMVNTEFVKATEEILKLMVERFFKFWWHHPKVFQFSMLKREQEVCLKSMHGLSDTIFQRRKSEYNERLTNKRIVSDTKFKSFIDLLLEHSNELSDIDIKEQIDTIIGAGYDTTGTTLMFVMLMLGAYPEIQEKALAELKKIFGDEDRDVNKHDLSQMVYLEAVIKETMRIHSTVPTVIKNIDKNVKLKNCTLSPGRTCFFFLFGFHRHPMWGPDRLQFRPERWLDLSQLPDTPNAFVGFSVGKRSCIGQVYAMMSMKTTLAHLLRHYRIIADDSRLRLKIDLVLKPLSGYYISIEKRN